MQIPAEYGEDYIVLAISVGLATIGVCVFGAVASVAALFILSNLLEVDFMAKLGTFFKTLGTKIATLWKTTTWFKIASIGAAVVIATSAVVIPNAIISETGGIFHKCDFSVESIDTQYSYLEANCTEKAKYYYSCACGAKGTDLFEYGIPLGHDLTHYASKQVTCTEIGYDEYDTCSRCDYTTYNEISATGHTDGKWITDVNATCTENGNKHQICSVCNDTIKTAVIPATGHTDGEWITDANATCTENGNKHQICSVCNDTIKTAVIPATGHTDGEWITDANATCTEDGSKHQICSVCNETIKTDVIASTGHTWGDWTNDIYPTCNADGTQYRSCLSCSTQENKNVSKLGHSKSELLSTEEIDDTFFGTWKCSRCGNTVRETYMPITAYIQTSSLTAGTYGWNFSWEIDSQGGIINTHQYSFVVTNQYSGQVYYMSSWQYSNKITWQSNVNDSWQLRNPIRVFVYISDGVGSVAYIFDMSTLWGIDRTLTYYSYTLN